MERISFLYLCIGLQIIFILNFLCGRLIIILQKNVGGQDRGLNITTLTLFFQYCKISQNKMIICNNFNIYSTHPNSSPNT